MTDCPNACIALARLEERLSQVEKRQDGDIDRLEKAIEKLTGAVTTLTEQANRWKGGMGTMLWLVGASGGLSGVVGYVMGKGH